MFSYGDFHALPGDKLHAAHNVLLHLDELRQFLGEVGAEGAGGVLPEGMSWLELVYSFLTITSDRRSLRPLPFPRGMVEGGSRPDQATSVEKAQ